MSLPGGGTVNASDKTSTDRASHKRKVGRVLLFFLYFFGFVFALPFLAVTLVQAKYGPIDGPPSFPADPFGERIKAVTLYGIFVWAGLQFFVFGRIASWAAQVPAVPGIEPAAAETLMQRLLSINEQDVPYTIKRGSRANELVVDWRYADAKWLDLMRIHGISKGYRLVLRFDGRARNVRAQDRYASFDWSAGRGPDLLSLNWSVSYGITFFEYRHERVFGLQFRDGKPTFDLSYAYTFDLNELKQPIIEIICHAGWNFRPVITFFRPIGG
ncbi:hypothetical protein [Reyranella massiliensis]|uniref:hypothetical protein n=1 Tax=Reyranella massiliensis TaxID=445220 RepID=UPI0002FE6867|nr:hypothetical protein [Reyranella massiliensis]